MTAMTKRQMECLRYLCACRRVGFRPCYQDIASALGMAGRPQAYRIVLDLRGQGMVAIPWRGAVRSIEVTAAGAAHVAGPIIINGARYRFVPAPGGDLQ